jgi:hypothetical protein
MQIHLLIPGLLWPSAAVAGPAAGLALAGLERMLGLGRPRLAAFEPLDRQFARLFGLAGSAPLPLAALRRLGEAGAEPPAPGSHWLCADPVNLAFSREHLLLHDFADDAADAPDRAEAAALVAALNDSFAERGRFEVCTPTRWYLRLAAPTHATFYPLHDAVGRPIRHFLPEGEGARLWQRTMNEAQIVLHNHPLSRAREAAGRRAVNSLWLWGAGELDDAPRAPLPAVQATDPLTIGLARAAGVEPRRPEPAAALGGDTLVVLDGLLRPAQQLDLDAWRAGLEALERDWFAPLAEALRRGRLQTLRLTAPGDRGTLELVVRAADRWKFWRQPQSFAALLQSAAPPPRTLPAAAPAAEPPTDVHR